MGQMSEMFFAKKENQPCSLFENDFPWGVRYQQNLTSKVENRLKASFLSFLEELTQPRFFLHKA